MLKERGFISYFVNFLVAIALVISSKHILFFKSSNSLKALERFPDFVIASHIFDADNDGRLDLLIASKNHDYPAEILLLNKSKFFKIIKDAFPSHYLENDGETVSLISNDFNNDGNQDVLAVTVDGRKGSYYESSKIHLYLGNGTGKFRDASEKIIKNKYEGWIEWIRLGDFDGDGAMDFLITDPGNSKKEKRNGGRIYLNDGKANFKISYMKMTIGNKSFFDNKLKWDSFSSVKNFKNKKYRYALDVFVGKINEDSLIDLVAPGGYKPGFMATFINESSPGKLNFRIIYSNLKGNKEDPLSIKNGVLLDLNSDGYIDLVGSQSISKSKEETAPLGIYLNNKSGRFVFAQNKFGVQHARQWLIGDFNGDRIDDLVIADHGWDKYPHSGASNLLLLGSKRGLVKANKESLADGSNFTHGLSVGDLDNDGDLDIFLNNNKGKRLWLNDGRGFFTGSKLKIGY